MHILNLRPTAAGATFDVEISPGIRLFNWTLKRTSVGNWTVYSPAAKGGTPTAMIAPAAREQVVAAALAAMTGGRAAHAPR